MFDELNKSNIKYSSIFYSFYDKRKIDYLKELNIDFNKIKRMTLIEEENINKYSNDIIFQTLFSINYIENNLLFLKIKFNNKINYDFIGENNLNLYFFDNIIKFKALRYLYIDSFQFGISPMIKLSNLKILSFNNCKSINMQTMFSEKLEILHLKGNKISNLDILVNVNFKGLKELDLSYNNISDIGLLENLKLEKLEKLNLGRNNISNIYILESVNFKELKELNLSANNISYICILKFEKLEILNLERNIILNIGSLENVNFKKLNLKELN